MNRNEFDSKLRTWENAQERRRDAEEAEDDSEPTPEEITAVTTEAFESMTESLEDLGLNEDEIKDTIIAACESMVAAASEDEDEDNDDLATFGLRLGEPTPEGFNVIGIFYNKKTGDVDKTRLFRFKFETTDRVKFGDLKPLTEVEG